MLICNFPFGELIAFCFRYTFILIPKIRFTHISSDLYFSYLFFKKKIKKN